MATMTKTVRRTTEKHMQATATASAADALRPEASPAAVVSDRTTPGDAVPAVEPEVDQIARLAYSYWEARGGEGGSAEDDWFRAERELRTAK